ncbi:uncharacterized protein LOC129724664 [Wyeomyia smithii]|uniref:uncharacterized protein LOC129724664 n=1 Tax=Wyeomyia smithii TaxID=174621 RepID=UPI002467B42B|nr:uncharacterized protein LOC129724664 [Wyeomyia smithii]
MYLKVIVLFLSVSYTAGYYTHKKHSAEDRNSENFRTLANYQQRLRNQGFYNRPINDNLSAGFDELETLQLIPVTIRQLRQSLLSSEERLALRNIFGSIWDMMVDESHRKKSEPRNPVLSILLNSREIRQGKQEIRAQFDSDTQGNSIQKVFKTQKFRPIKLTDDSGVEPSQRLLRMVAAIIQKSYKESNRQKDSIKLNNAKVTVRLPRNKRSIISVISAKSEEEQRRLVKAEANEAAVMKTILGDNGDDSRPDDDDDYYADDDYPEHATEEVSGNASNVDAAEDTANDLQAAASDKPPKSEEATQDYAYDEGEDVVDYFMDQFKPRSSPGNFEDPSFNELIMLAARHRARKQHQKVGKSENNGGYRTAASDEYLDDYY